VPAATESPISIARAPTTASRVHCDEFPGIMLPPTGGDQAYRFGRVFVSLFRRGPILEDARNFVKKTRFVQRAVLTSPFQAAVPKDGRAALFPRHAIVSKTCRAASIVLPISAS